MALVHANATISPTKLEIARQWLVATDWFDGDTDALDMGFRHTYRFDDPDGEVGVEVLLVNDGDRVLQVPLTYRAAQLADAEEFFVAHMDHSVLGRRWIYDGSGDPVFVNALLQAALTGAQQEDFEAEVEGEIQMLPAVVRVRGTGTAAPSPPVAVLRTVRAESTTWTHTRAGALVLPHVAGDIDLAGRPGLLGSWPDRDGDIPLAAVDVASGYRG